MAPRAFRIHPVFGNFSLSTSDGHQSGAQTGGKEEVAPLVQSLATALIAQATDAVVHRNLSRPNGMNEHGVPLGELGINANAFLRDFVLPVAKMEFGEWGMFSVDRVHAFML